MMNSKLILAAALLSVGMASAQDYPRAETFAGYTYTRFNSASNVPAFSANGGGGQLAVNANRWIGFVADVGAVHNGNIGSAHLDSTFTNFLFGPRISLRHSRVTPYFNVLFGGVHAGTSTNVTGTALADQLPVYLPGAPAVVPGQAVTLRATASQTAFAMTSGGGLDIKINRHLSFRPIGLDYLMTRLQNLRSKQDNNQHNLRYTTGFNFTFGGEAPTPPPPPPPPTRACWDNSTVPVGSPCPNRSMDLQLAASTSELCPGGSAVIRPSAAVPEGATYQWTIQGEPVGKGPTLDFGSTGRQAGAYKVGLAVAAPEYNEATAESTITVREYGPPTGTLEASPAEILAGERATLRANVAAGPCGTGLRPPVYTASEGAVRGNQFDSSDVQFDPASKSEQRKTVRIVAQVADDRGSATIQGSVVVKKPAATMATRLPDIVFPAGSARVNNCGKRVLLEELKAATDTDPAGKVVFVGHVSQSEAGKAGLDRQRALNAAAVISAGSGVCSSFPAAQTLVGASGTTDNGVDFQSRFCGASNELPGSVVKETESDAKFRRVEVWFVPSGGAMPAGSGNYQDAASLAVSRLGCPR